MNKKVLITGASHGLGRATASEFAKHNFDIVLTYLTSENEANTLKRELESEYKVSVEIYRLDLKDDNSCWKLIDSIDNLDVLINNAAYNEDKEFETFTSKDFLDTYQINVVGAYNLSVGLKPLLDSSHGCIVNVASTNGIDTMYKESAPYDASKAALINLTKNMSVAFAPNVRVNAVAPGWIDTPSTTDMEPKFKELAENSNVLHRFATPEEIAKMIYFLASEDASYMTGSIIKIDGGNRYGNR